MISGTWILCVLLGISFSFSLGQIQNSCLENCDVENPGGYPVTMCGTDYLTHYTHTDNLGASGCYMCSCLTMTYYEGICGCPNDCFSDFGLGHCSDDGTCSCNSSWGGKDCSLPMYGNVCGLHGKIIMPNDKSSAFPFEYCQCDDGWTGIDCSSPIFRGKSLPWGNVFDGDYYTSEDKYGDDHPVWNISTLATIRLEMNESDYVNLLQPWNLYNQTYAKVNVYFDNGYTHETILDAGIHIKGKTFEL